MKKIFTLLFITVLFASCSSDDASPVTGDGTANGKWNLDRYVAFLPEPAVIRDGDITWTLTSLNTLVVNNRIESRYPFMIPSGNYTVSFTANGFAIEGAGTYLYKVEDDILSVYIPEGQPDEEGNIVADNGMSMKFSRR
jgi:hypothetical protein